MNKMVDARLLHSIPLYKMAGSNNNWNTLPVIAKDDESFFVTSCRGRIDLKDEDLKPDSEGRVIIDITSLDLKFLNPNDPMPTEFEMPQDVLAARKEKRRLNALAKDAIFINRYADPMIYFYLEGEKLRILCGEIEVVADEMKIIYGKPAIKADGLNTGSPYYQLPAEVAGPWEKILKEKELKKLALVLRGKSLLNSKKYYGFNMEPPRGMWSQVNGYFEDFGNDDKDLNGFLTCYPGTVAEILGIPIEAGL